MNNKSKWMTFLCSLSLLVSCSPQKEQPKGSLLLCHEDEITEIIGQMTLEEKVNMLHGKNMFSSAGVERLGIPDIEYADGPFGIREEMEPHSWNSLGLANDSSTFFPTGSALAATWSEEMAYEYGKGMAKEARLRGKDMILGPAINIQRIPTGGRTYEYLSEDPQLSAALSVKYTQGVQDNGVAVCLKHYALNNQENDRGSIDVKVSPRAMHELYLPPFEAAVKEADAYGVMAAYNKVEGYWCSENDMLLNKILRDMWGFHGIVISDWGGVHSTVGAAMNGLDVEMPGERYMGQALLDSVKAGVVPEEVIDSKVRNLLRVRFAIQPIAKEDANKVMTAQPEQRDIAYKVACKSIVMLKNEGELLPILPNKYKKIAVIGDNAIRQQAQGGVGAGVKALKEVTPLEGIENKLNNFEIKWAQGYYNYTREDRYKNISPYQKADKELMAEAVQLAKESDLVLFIAGNNREVETEGSDRTCITLPMGQDELAQALAEANPNLVTILVSGAPTDLRVVNEVSPAILVSWFNGSEGGNALADVLSGAIVPSGKLPFTYPIQLEDNQAYSLKVYPQVTEEEKEDIFVNLVNQKDGRQRKSPIANYSEGIFVGYRWFESKQIPVAYPFGHGLSYTTFDYSDLQLETTKQGIQATLQLTNTGKYDAEEVVQFYIGRPNSQVERPLKELKAFQRVSLKAGESKPVQIFIPRERFRHWDEIDKGWKIESGKADVYVGSSSQDIRLNGSTNI